MQEPTGSLVHSYSPFPPSFLLKEPQFFANIKKSDVFGIAMSFFNLKERIMIGLSQSWQPPFHCPGIDLSFSTGWGLVSHFWYKIFENKSVLWWQGDFRKNLSCCLKKTHGKKYATHLCSISWSCIYFWCQYLGLVRMHMSQDPETNKWERYKDPGNILMQLRLSNNLQWKYPTYGFLIWK